MEYAEKGGIVGFSVKTPAGNVFTILTADSVRGVTAECIEANTSHTVVGEIIALDNDTVLQIVS